MFELLCPATTVVVRYASERIVCHGARDLVTLRECRVQPLGGLYGWETAQTWPVHSLEEARGRAARLTPTGPCGEGFVVVDGCFRRLKVKAPSYVALVSMRNVERVRDVRVAADTKQANWRRMLEVVRTQEGAEFLAYYPQ